MYRLLIVNIYKSVAEKLNMQNENSGSDYISSNLLFIIRYY